MPPATPFSAFMARALYDPARGYYTRQIPTVGVRGDFSTTATLSPILGQAIAAWIRQESRRQPQVRNIIEIGAGTGELMAAVRQSLGWWNRRRFRWHIVETSPVLKEQQRKRLGSQITWHQELKAALEQAGGQAFIYHNELLDAFPATLLQWADAGWQEIHVTPAGQELSVPLDWPESETQFYHALRDWHAKPPQQRVELHPSIRQWLHEWSPAWTAGAMLTIDYGDEFPALYHRRPRGTLRAYLFQQRLTGLEVYQNVGRQDITTDINFSDYRQWTRELGWQESAYGSQADFILKHARPIAGDAKAAFLLHPDGAGQAFKHIIHYPENSSGAFKHTV